MTGRPRPSSPPAPGALLDTALDVARRYRDFDQYGSERAAGRALRRRRPGAAAAQYERALGRALALFDDAVALAEREAARLLERSEHGRFGLADDPLLAALRQSHRGFPAPSYVWVLEWAFYWHVLR